MAEEEAEKCGYSEYSHNLPRNPEESKHVFGE
jgi:hypothetical protein